MTLELVGMIGVHPARSASRVNVIGGSIDPAFVRDFTRAHEASGFDRVLVGYSSASADAFVVAQHAAAGSERIGFLIAHRPGFVLPTVTARRAATLDRFAPGRIALHIISGGSDEEQRRDGDFLAHDERYRRTDEYVGLLRRAWSATEPFDHNGEFYRLRGAYSEVRPQPPDDIPIYFGGSSGAALAVAAKHCDVYAMWGEPRAAVAAQIAAVHRAAAAHGRRPRISVSFRPIVAQTEAAAWERAHAILARIEADRKASEVGAITSRQQSEGARRLLSLAARADIHDERLWMPVAAATGAAGNTSALVGTATQVAGALLAYYDLGVSTILIRGFDPYNDAVDFGRELIPRLRACVAERERAAVQA